MKLRLYQNSYAIVKLASVPDTLLQTLHHSIYSLTVTDQELSLVCESRFVPAMAVEVEDDWCLMGVDAVMDFDMIGIIASIAKILAEQEISIFVISSYDTDYLLVRDIMRDRACDALRDAGYIIVE